MIYIPDTHVLWCCDACMYIYIAANPAETTKLFPLGDQELALRGSKLVNTKKVFGVVAYVGSETKMMLNRNQRPYKFSRFERHLNLFVLALFIFNLVMCLLLALGARIWEVRLIYILFKKYIDITCDLLCCSLLL